MLQIVNTILNILLVVVFLYLVISWTQPDSNSIFGKLGNLISTIVKPFLVVVRRILPPRGGTDYSPLILFFLIWVIQILIGS